MDSATTLVRLTWLLAFIPGIAKRGSPPQPEPGGLEEPSRGLASDRIYARATLPFG